MASRPGVTVTVSQAVVYHDNLGVDLTASTLSGRSTYTLYVEVSGVHVSRYGGNPIIFSPGSRVASDGPGGEYSIGRSYLLKPGYSYNLTFSVSYAGCGCLRVSGPYVSVSPLGLDPVLLTSTKTNAGGIPVTPHVNTVGWPTPGRPRGKYYVTSLSSIAPGHQSGAHCAFPGRSSATRDATTDHGACGAGRNPRSYHRPDP